jgi:heme/copper-type cytochrome/quinol oxidase subunit 2
MLGTMALRITVGIAGALGLFLCFNAMRDVPHNTAIRNSEPTMTILWMAVVLIIVTGILALTRNSKKTTVFSLLASGFGILFSFILASV